jgi:hypothetical protein
MKSISGRRVFMHELVAVAFILIGVLAVGTVNFAHAKSPAAPSFAENELEWRQIVGIFAPGNVVGSGNGKVTGAGPWHATRGSAEVNLTTGDVRFDVEGLVLAAGNSIGTPGPVAQVRGTLVCDTTGTLNGNSTIVDTPLVTLSTTGDARFHGNVGALPVACTSQPNIAFLVRAGNGLWLASGMVRTNETDDDRR